MVLCELAEGGGEPGVVGSRSDEPQTEDGIVRHLGVSVVRELAAIHKSSVLDPDSNRSVDPNPDPNPGWQNVPQNIKNKEISCFEELDVLF